MQPGASISVPLKVILAQNEDPIRSLFRIETDSRNSSFVAQGGTVVNGSEKRPPYRIETIEITVTVPDADGYALKPCRIYAPGFQVTRDLLKHLDGKFGTEEMYLAVVPSNTTWMRQNNPDDNVSFRAVYNDRRRFTSDQATYSVIDSDAKLDEFLGAFPTSSYTNQIPDPLPRPSVDFSSESLVVMAFGAQPSGAVRGEITRIQEFPDKLRVLPILWLPAPWHIVTADVGYPIHMVAVSKPHKPITFAQIYESWAE
ncbi:hypothetical protein D3C86_1405310 [compost metagenome]